MMDRKTLWISWLLIAAMTAAGFWRLSLLPDWHHLPANGPRDSHTINGLFVFWGPFILLFLTFLLFARKWFVAGPEESEGPWRRYSGLTIVLFAAIIVPIQAFIIARSLGVGAAIDRATFARAVVIATGILIMVLGNALPKMPWLSARFRPFHLDEWQWNRQLRFTGRIMFGVGLATAISGPLLPLKMALPMQICLCLAMLGALLWHRARVKRESSPHP
jgi:hypothetical protein